jgi:L-aspartate oxidase
MGKIAAQNATKQKRKNNTAKTKKQEKAKEGINQEIAFSAMKKIMWKCCGVIRTQQNLNEGLARITALEEKMEKNETNKCIAIQKALKVCKLTIEAAIKRKESIGTHYIEN